jgi:hypothetical protein
LILFGILFRFGKFKSQQKWKKQKRNREKTNSGEEKAKKDVRTFFLQEVRTFLLCYLREDHHVRAETVTRAETKK